ncbi:cytochrome c family protein [Pedomonas sp.]|uniref:c-type cytochrome n=1 Tax=Pedomonas sp. TaxID=2976421 RepID=UPI002F407C7F
MLKQVFVVLLLAAAVPSAYSADVEAGKRVFQKCASCHKVGPNARSGFGPQLNGIVGRRAGSAPDYAYSKAIKNSGVVWTEENLAAFVRDTDDVVPGNKMRFWGISNEKQIADLLAYLSTLR